MENSKTKSDLQTLKSRIQKIVDMYNAQSKEDQLNLTVTKKNQVKRQPEKLDVSKYYVCTYGAEQTWVGCFFLGGNEYIFDSIGLFKKEHDMYEKTKHRDGYYFMGCWEESEDYTVKFDHQVYTGVDSDQIAIEELTHDGKMPKNPGSIVTLSDDRKLSATCVIDKAYSFDNIRLRLYQDGLIGPYEIGKATNGEILEVLAYVQKMFSGEPLKEDRKPLQFHS